MHTGSIIKMLRKKKGVSQVEMALRMGVSRQRYNEVENNLVHKKVSYIFDIMIVLDCDETERNEIFEALKKDYLTYR